MKRADVAVLVGLAMAVCVGGCATPPMAGLRFESRLIPGVTRLAAFAAAQQVLVDRGYRLDRADVELGVITTEPTFAKPNAQMNNARATLSSSEPGRRVVEVRLFEDSSSVTVQCRVGVQLLTTEAYRMFRHEAAGADIPNETAIDLGAGSTAEQDAVWKTVRRDKPMERQLINAIVTRASAWKQ